MVAILISALWLGLPSPPLVAKPALKVAIGPPLRVHGDHFGASERITVTVLTGRGARIAHVTAARGAFDVKFDVPMMGCGAAYAVTARDTSGRSAHVAFAEPPICVPPPRD